MLAPATNWCVVFTRPYSSWPMSTFRFGGDHIGEGHQQFYCWLVPDLTDTFIHPIVTESGGHKVDNSSGAKALSDWLSSYKGKSSNLNENTGYCSAAISSADLRGAWGPVQ